ncbi:G-type lectin S-receptor-like serine/threonine-protein kinase At5g24080 [Gastrolobium bilobum]|uniref:G-type lectin S-receptor-like serine/threonine-protein kinase At5g24080 n=1 Tax=Gastrolobium bilobum TaxID=150636 RepID=UPI002AB282CA|nr:G-type lectin S-receptor-like serine/threonine-protein kinase At5g24080 [Gastrolobium bilobum]
MVLGCFSSCISSQIDLGSRLLASKDQTWVSDNGTFALGFTPAESDNRLFNLGIWFAELPGDRTLVWSPNRDSPVSQDAILELDTTGNLVLMDGDTTIWASNTSGAGVEAAVMAESGNFIIHNTNNHPVWQSFSQPSDTLLPNQPLTVSLELTSSKSSSHGGYYALKMLQQPTSLSLALTYNLPETYPALDESYTNYSYWQGPDISNVTGEVIAVLDQAGSFGIVYGESSEGAVYVYKNDDDDAGLSSAVHQSTPLAVLRRLTLEKNGNLRLYRWDDDVNGSRQWMPEWAAVSNPCDVAAICGNGVCNLDRSKTKASCTCLPGTSKVGRDGQCFENSSLVGKCNAKHENQTSQFRISVVQQTNYYFSEFSVIANYSDVASVSKCGDACLSDCDCVASVYGLNEERPYCWVLRSLNFGGFEDTSSTLFVKERVNNGSWTPEGQVGGSNSSSDGLGSAKEKAVIIPIVLSMTVLIALLCLLLYYSVHRKRTLRREMESSLILSGAPMNFTFRDLQIRTCNFSQLLGTGGFGSVYKGSLGDGTLVAVKKLERVLPHGEKEFITEVNTIGSMHHMNLVRLCGYCSEGSHRLLVYEFMKNGSLDKWIFPSYQGRDRVLDWPTRFNIAITTAQGIAYFHEQCRNRIIHCDIKPENILLDENFCPKVSDFGLAKLMAREHSHVVTMVRGTRGYLAPEWVSNRPITVKADVYSYGMLLLEIIGGRRNLDMSFDAEDFFYPGWAYKELTNGSTIKVADRRLNGAVDEEELMRALKVAFWCIQDEVFIRPTMGEIVRMLEGSMDINMPPMPQTVLELIEEGLDHVYKAMKREYNQFSSFTINSHLTSHATCSNSTMSPR